MVGIGGVRQVLVAWLAPAVVLWLAPAVVLFSAPAAGAVNATDRAASAGYLRAAYTLDAKVSANLSVSRAAAKAEENKIVTSCRGVLAHAPYESGEVVAVASETQRQKGERARLELQILGIRLELARSLATAAFAPDHAALAAFRSTVDSLHWSEPALARLAARAGAQITELAEPPQPDDVCADLRAWVASGYRRIAPETHRAAVLFESYVTESLLSPGTGRLGESLSERLEPFEDGPLRSLARRTAKLGFSSHELEGREGATDSIIRLEEEVGLVRRRPAEDASQSILVGIGITATDGRFAVSVEHGSSAPSRHCGVATEIEYEANTDFVGGAGSSSSGSAQRCGPPGSKAPGPEVDCEDGEVAVQLQTGPAVRRVRLHLRGGRTITSRVVRVPRRLGGPVGVYYQTVRLTGPRPVSLAELGASGRVLARLSLKVPGKCRANGLAPEVVSLASGATLDGGTYSLLALSSGGSGAGAHLHPYLTGTSGATLTETSSQSEKRAGPLRLWISTACEANEESVVYGVLSASGDTVRVGNASSQLTLAETPVPASLADTGTIVHGAILGVPQAITVLAPNGAVVASLDLSKQAGEEREFCSGYDEP